MRILKHGRSRLDGMNLRRERKLFATKLGTEKARESAERRSVEAGMPCCVFALALRSVLEYACEREPKGATRVGWRADRGAWSFHARCARSSATRQVHLLSCMQSGVGVEVDWRADLADDAGEQGGGQGALRLGTDVRVRWLGVTPLLQKTFELEGSVARTEHYVRPRRWGPGERHAAKLGVDYFDSVAQLRAFLRAAKRAHKAGKARAGRRHAGERAAEATAPAEEQKPYMFCNTPAEPGTERRREGLSGLD